MKNIVAKSHVFRGKQKTCVSSFCLNNVIKAHRNYFYLILFATLVVFSSCTAQSRLSSRLKTEWNIVEYEVRNNNGSGTTIENAGTITFNRNGQGSQSFTTAITHTGQTVDSQFNWENTANTVTIRTTDNQQPRVWIVVNSSRTSQKWYSTDSAGNVQVMKLERK